MGIDEDNKKILKIFTNYIPGYYKKFQKTYLKKKIVKEVDKYKISINSFSINQSLMKSRNWYKEELIIEKIRNTNIHEFHLNQTNNLIEIKNINNLSLNETPSGYTLNSKYDINSKIPIQINIKLSLLNEIVKMNSILLDVQEKIADLK